MPRSRGPRFVGFLFPFLSSAAISLLESFVVVTGCIVCRLDEPNPTLRVRVLVRVLVLVLVCDGWM